MNQIHHIGGKVSTKFAIARRSRTMKTGTMSVHSNRIRQERTKRGLTQAELADRCNTTNQQISRLEAGQRELTQSWLERLARALDINPVRLLPAEMTELNLDAYRAPEVNTPGFLGAVSAWPSHHADERALAARERGIESRLVRLVREGVPRQVRPGSRSLPSRRDLRFIDDANPAAGKRGPDRPRADGTVRQRVLLRGVQRRILYQARAKGGEQLVSLSGRLRETVFCSATRPSASSDSSSGSAAC